jgi:hypothetical protein
MSDLKVIQYLKLFYFAFIRRFRLNDYENYQTENHQMTPLESNFPLLKNFKTPKHSEAVKKKKKNPKLPQETKLNFSLEITTCRKGSQGSTLANYWISVKSTLS